MKFCFIAIAAILIVVSSSAQTDWPHNDFDAGIPLSVFFGNYDASRYPTAYSEHLKSLPDGKDGVWILVRYYTGEDS